MPALLPVMLASSHLLLVAAPMPQLDIAPGCREAAAAAIAPNRNESICKRDESDARGKLEQKWSQFSPGQKKQCVALSGLGGYPSYVELLTCLEMAKDADNAPDSDRPAGGAKP